MDPIILARRLRIGREDTGLSQQQAAEFIGIPRTAITQIEQGKRSVSTLEISKFASLYQKPLTYFFSEDEENEDALVALLRVEPGLENDQEVKNRINACMDLCREGSFLERLVGRSPRSGPPMYTVGIPQRVADAVKQAELVAEQERRRLGIGANCVGDLPELISNQGIWAAGEDLPDSISGLFLRHESVGLVILVNAKHSKARKRFSYAHEYAHALMDREQSVTVSNAGNAAELVEKRANAFAAAFLMPKEGVIELLKSLDKGNPSREEKVVFDAATGGHIEVEQRNIARLQQITYQDAVHVAHHFGVSYHAAVYRIKSLGFISHKECEELIEQYPFGSSYLKALDMFSDIEAKEENEKLWDRELRSQILYLALEAYRREEISQGKLFDVSKKLSIPSAIIADLAKAARPA